MSDFEMITPLADSDGRSIWTAAVQQGENNKFRALYVLTPDAFHYAKYSRPKDQVKALERVQNDDDPRDALGEEGVAFSLGRIVRVEKVPGEETLSIQVERAETTRWENLLCPDDLGDVLFQALRQCLRPRLRSGKERISPLKALAGPLGVLIVTVILILMVGAGANIAERENDPNAEQPVWRNKATRGAIVLGGLLGMTGVVIVGTLAVLGVLAWSGFVVTRRPLKNVLRAHDRDEREEPDEPRQVEARDGGEREQTFLAKCTACGRKLRLAADMAGRSVRCPACDQVLTIPASVCSQGIAERPQATRPVSDPERPLPARRPRSSVRSASNVALILGIVALAVGVPALAASWVSAVRVLIFVVAALGLVVGVVGVVLASIQTGPGLGFSIAGGSVNFLAVMVAVVALVVTRNKARDGDDSGQSGGAKQQVKALAWGQATDPDGDCSIREVEDAVTIHVPATPHDLSTELNRVNAPRVLQEVEGDFRAEVKVTGVFRPPVAGNVPGRVAYQSGGLLLWIDNRNYVRLERAALNRGGASQSMLAFEMRTNGQMSAAPMVGVGDQDFYLRLERRGNLLIAAFSVDGRQWTPIQPLPMAMPAKVRIGITAVNAAQAPLTVRFERFQVGP